MALLGPNGAGKTTLLKLITRDVYPQAVPGAAVRVMGRARWNIWDLRGQIGWVSPEIQADFPAWVTVRDAIASGFFQSVGVDVRQRARLSRGQHTRVSELVRSMGLVGLESRQYGTLSTGQQRRALLARALIHEPHTLVLDEPTVGLDMAAGFEFLARIRELAAAGCSLVLVTHHLNEIPREIERVIILKQGKVASDGRKGDVLTPENLSAIYEMPIDVAQVNGHFLAHQP